MVSILFAFTGEARALYVRSMVVDDKYVWIDAMDFYQKSVKRLSKDTGKMKNMPFKGQLLNSDNEHLYFISEPSGFYARVNIDTMKIDEILKRNLLWSVNMRSLLFEKYNNTLWVVYDGKLCKWNTITGLKEYIIPEIGQTASGLSAYPGSIVVRGWAGEKYAVFDKETETLEIKGKNDIKFLSSEKDSASLIADNNFLWGTDSDHLLKYNSSNKTVIKKYRISNPRYTKSKPPLALYIVTPILIGVSPREKNIMAASSIAGELAGGFIGAIGGRHLYSKGMTRAILIGSVGGSVIATNIAKKQLDTKLSVSGTVVGTLLGTYASLALFKINEKSPELIDVTAILAVAYLGARTGMEIPLIRISW